MNFKNTCDIVGPHIESFNYFITEGLDNAVKDIEPEEFQISLGDVKPIVRLKILDVKISNPCLDSGVSRIVKIYPSECRQRRMTYGGKMRIKIGIKINQADIDPIERVLGDFPIMVKSRLCNLCDLNIREIIKHGEEEKEKGGYFIVNGTEKIIRLLIVNRRNYPMAFSRNGWKKRGATYTEHGIYMRCYRDNHTATLNTLHYLMTRRMMLCFSHRKEMFFVPVIEILRALLDEPESYIFNALICGRQKDDVWKKSIMNMLNDLHDDGITSRMSALKHLGGMFRVSLQAPDHLTDVEVGKRLIRKCILIHLNDEKEKFDLLCYMMHKLRAYVNGECREDNPDNIMFHEAALPGHILLMILKEKLEMWLQKLRRQLQEDVLKKGSDLLLKPKAIADALKIAMKFDISRAIEYFLATGTLVSSTGLGLQQTTGFTIIAERLNYLRFVSHFRGIHRGAFFTTMRATDVRKLRPEAWGFLCPVHTPDGTPCGLLNHLTASCRVVSFEQGCGSSTSNLQFHELIAKLSSLGMLTLDEFRLLGILVDDSTITSSKCATAAKQSSSVMLFTRVFVDSRWIGWIEDNKAQMVAEYLRSNKILNLVQQNFEIVLVPKPSKAGVKGLYPGLFVFTTPGRLVRPVMNLSHKCAQEYIGTLEQVFLNICIEKSEAKPGITTHQEINAHSFLSFVANLIPYSDHNQSPRNVYQCQMGKQTMGIPAHRIDKRVDNKLYKLQTPQSPLVRPAAYDDYGIDDYGLGTNAIVAVISYTGYDMEDSMVINKTSFERGFAQASVLKCERINLINSNSRRSRVTERLRFCRDPSDTTKKLAEFVDEDGLPYVGRLYREHDPFYCYKSEDTGKYVTKTYHHPSSAYCHQIKICSSETNNESDINHVCITIREERNPSMGDKFASRHGQKGMLSFLWPTENMPFTESGMVPDIIFNPHGFPSRMTVGMMIEFMAGKSAALHGLKHNAAPFIFSEQNPAAKYFGDLLAKAGYNYLGNEPIYSGVDGREMKADIFFGVVYYQKLRHMVEDKFQVRATGPVEELTGQPVHGRKRGGGVRFGEMERDALISHGCAFLLQDRLFNCSDKDYTEICSKCGCTIGVYRQSLPQKSEQFRESSVVSYCRICQSADHVKIVAVPTVFKLLTAELNCMNIKMQFSITS